MKTPTKTLVLSGGKAGARLTAGARERYSVTTAATLQAAAGGATRQTAVRVTGDHVEVRDLAFSAMDRAIEIQGTRIDLVGNNLTFDGCGYGITNLDAANVPLGSLAGFELSNIIGSNVGQNGIRLAEASAGRISDCSFDGAALKVSSIPSGVNLEAGCHGIAVSRVSCHNMVSSSTSPSAYWNGDGFTSERGCYDLQYIDCAASNCSDGGYDLKSESTTLTRCLSQGNKYSYRIWSSDPVLVGCRSLNPSKIGGSGVGAHFQFNRGLGTGRVVTLTAPYVRGDAAHLSPLFEINGAAEPLIVNITDWDIVVDPDTPLFGSGDMTAVPVLNWNPPFPTPPVFSIVWRVGYEGGLIPVGTPAGRVVADIKISGGTAVAALIGASSLLSIVGTTVVTTAVAPAGAFEDFIVRVSHPSGLAKAWAASTILTPAAMDPDAQAVISRMAVPPIKERSTVINATVVKLKAEGLWPLIDHLLFPAAHDIQAARLDWKGASGDATGTTGAPVWTADRGLSGTASAYWTGASAALTRTRDGAHVAAYPTVASTNSGNDIMDASSRMLIAARGGSSTGVRVSQTTGNSSPPKSAGAAPGLFTAVRPDAARELIYRNSELIATVAKASNASPGSLFRYGGSPRTNGMFSVGGALTGAQVASLSRIARAYLIRVGAVTV